MNFKKLLKLLHFWLLMSLIFSALVNPFLIHLSERGCRGWGLRTMSCSDAIIHLTQNRVGFAFIFEIIFVLWKNLSWPLLTNALSSKLYLVPKNSFFVFSIDQDAEEFSTFKQKWEKTINNIFDFPPLTLFSLVILALETQFGGLVMPQILKERTLATKQHNMGYIN